MSKAVNDLKDMYMSGDEVCEVLHIKKRTLYNWVYMKKLVPVKFGNKNPLYKIVDVKRLLK